MWLYSSVGRASHRRSGVRIPLEALIFFRLLLSNCLNWKIYCDDHSSLHLQPQYKYELFHIYFTSLHCTEKYELNKLTSLPFIAQLVEHRTGGQGFESRWNPDFFQSTNMNYFIYTSHHHCTEKYDWLSMCGFIAQF